MTGTAAMPRPAFLRGSTRRPVVAPFNDVHGESFRRVSCTKLPCRLPAPRALANAGWRVLASGAHGILLARP